MIFQLYLILKFEREKKTILVMLQKFNSEVTESFERIEINEKGKTNNRVCLRISISIIYNKNELCCQKERTNRG